MPPDWCPASRRDQPPDRWTRARREKELNTPTAGPGPGTRDLNTPSVGPRCLQRATSIRSGSAPSWDNSSKESESILRDRTRAEGCPQVSRAGNTGKPDNGVIVAGSHRCRVALGQAPSRPKW